MRTPPPTDPHPPKRGPLTAAMVALAGMPEHASGLERHLNAIAVLTVERVAAARYASITAMRGKAYITVAFTDELARAVDDAQYADNTGPCLEAYDTGTPVAVPDIAAASVRWPGFHETAPRMGLRASVSVPLYAGRGEPVAVLNTYSHDRVAMAPLIAGIISLHGPVGDESGELEALDEGGRELVAGYAESLSIRATIKLALNIIMADNHCTGDEAYVSLCLQADVAGTDLAAAAAALVTREM
jgi:GAF domain-containing protein